MTTSGKRGMIRKTQPQKNWYKVIEFIIGILGNERTVVSADVQRKAATIYSLSAATHPRCGTHSWADFSRTTSLRPGTSLSSCLPVPLAIVCNSSPSATHSKRQSTIFGKKGMDGVMANPQLHQHNRLLSFIKM